MLRYEILQSIYELRINVQEICYIGFKCIRRLSIEVEEDG